MKVVVAGGSGLIGSKLVRVLGERGHEVVSAARETGINTITGEGLPGAMVGAAVVIDVTNAPPLDGAGAMHFFATSTRNLLDVEAAAGVRHHVALSIVGAERLAESAYFRAKSMQERLIQESPVPYTIVHATQFYEFITGIGDAATVGGSVRLAPVQFQPMAADDVAAALVRIALQAPRNGMVEIAGPERFRLDELVRETLAARGDRREVLADPTARYFGAMLDERTLLPAADAWTAGTRLEEWRRSRADG